MKDDNRFILQHNMMKRLVLNKHRRRRLLAREHAGQEKEKSQMSFHGLHSRRSSWLREIRRVSHNALCAIGRIERPATPTHYRLLIYWARNLNRELSAEAFSFVLQELSACVLLH